MSVLTPRWRLVLETALDAVVIMDRLGMVVDWNHNAAAVFGWTADEVRGRLMADFIIPPQYREAHASGLRRYLDTGEAKVLGRRIEIWGLRRSGEEFPVELSISPISETDGLIFVGFLRDISERRTAERQREQHARKMEALYSSISFAAESNSLDDALQVCLACVQKLTGWPLGHVYLPSGDEPVRLLPSPMWHASDPDTFSNFRAATEHTSFAPGEGLPGRVWQSREPEWISNVKVHADFPRAHQPGGVEIKSAIGFPVVASDQVIAVVEFFSDTAVPPDDDLLLTLRAIGQQVGRVFERRHAEQTLREHASSLEAEIAERIRAQEHQKLLLAEVNHRVKNMLAVVTAIAAQTARNSADLNSFSQNFLARLHALANAHSLLTTQSWQAVPLVDVAEAILLPYREHGTLHVSGGPVMLPPKVVLSVGMVLHELVTNAAKYGALSAPTGKVSLRWESRARSEPWVRLVWQETGIGPVAPPARTGFGTAMISASIQHDLKGAVSIGYGADGLQYDIEFPLKVPN